MVHSNWGVKMADDVGRNKSTRCSPAQVPSLAQKNAENGAERTLPVSALAEVPDLTHPRKVYGHAMCAE